MKQILIASLLIVSSFASANQNLGSGKITSIETFEITNNGYKSVGSDVNGAGGGETIEPKPRVDRVQRAGQIIAVAKDFVALGEQIYELVKKGKPTNTTEYAPVSVVPKDPTTKEIIDPFELEGFSMPVQKRYVTVMKSGLIEAVRFEYMVMYSFGGSYNGVGKYITGAQIIPGAVKTTFGWDFNASMKVSGIMNHGTKAQPVAGLMLIVKYQMNSWSTAEERNDTFHITGRGELKSYTSK
jgi:hypothetical protein